MKLKECKLGLTVSEKRNKYLGEGLIIGFGYLHGRICPLILWNRDILTSQSAMNFEIVSNEINDIGEYYEKNLEAIVDLIDKDPELKSFDGKMLLHLAEALKEYEDIFFSMEGSDER